MRTDTDRTAAFPTRQGSGSEQTGSREDQGRAREHAGVQQDYASARDYDEYRIKLYKVACRAARERREQLRIEWEQGIRERS